ncbi:MAG: tryptophan--tRNA ligase [Mycoplasmataceae bacterium]|nr:tryptophan--tRNA ligase [Mycoplasmataceae bacterium]
MKKRIFTGLTATGDLTIGNYLGAIKNILESQDKEDKEVFLFIADLHGLTEQITAKEIRANVLNHLKIYLAAGIDVNKVKLFVQSSIIGHTELAWFLTVNSTMGQLSRLTQFKDKSQKQANKTKSIPTGIFMYPTLMAADILLYNADEIPLGEDQRQHLELTRDLAQKINKKYKLHLQIPKMIVAKEGAKIFALQNPDKKMSKSDSNLNNTIFLLDDEKVIAKKINNAITDSENKVYFDPINKPGVSNLMTIYGALNNLSMKEAEEKLKTLDYKELKQTVIKTLNELLLPLQKKYNELTKKDIIEALAVNKDYVQEEAYKTLKVVKERFGLIYE